MTHLQRLKQLSALNWIRDETSGRHQICAERCDWIAGTISGVEWSAWIGEKTGMVYLHGVAPNPGELDFTFDAFCELAKNGWPVKKVAPAARGFDFGD